MCIQGKGCTCHASGVYPRESLHVPLSVQTRESLYVSYIRCVFAGRFARVIRCEFSRGFARAFRRMSAGGSSARAIGMITNRCDPPSLCQYKF